MASAAQNRRMSNPLRILKTLDQHLTLPAEITLFGRSALALGYSPAPVHFHNTKDGLSWSWWADGKQAGPPMALRSRARLLAWRSRGRPSRR